MLLCRDRQREKHIGCGELISLYNVEHPPWLDSFDQEKERIPDPSARESLWVLPSFHGNAEFALVNDTTSRLVSRIYLPAFPLSCYPRGSRISGRIELHRKSEEEMDSFGWESYSPAVDYDASISTKTGENYLYSYSNFGDLDLAEALFRPAEPSKMDELLPSPSLDTARWLAAILNASSATNVNPPVISQLCINAREEELPTILSTGNASSGESENCGELFSRCSSSPDAAFPGPSRSRPTLKRKQRETGFEGASARKETGFRINFESQGRVDFGVYNGYEPDVEAIAQVKEMIYRAAAMRPINSASLMAAEKPKRKNVKISSDPQTVAARQRRERISERLRVLQSLVPGGSKMDTASMLDEAANYLKFLKSQVNALKTLDRGFGPQGSSNPSSSLPLSSSFDHSFAQMQTGAPNLP